MKAQIRGQVCNLKQDVEMDGMDNESLYHGERWKVWKDSDAVIVIHAYRYPIILYSGSIIR